MQSPALRRSILVSLVAGALGCAGAQRPPEAKPADAPTASTAAPPAGAAPSGEAPRAPDAVMTGLVFTVEPAEAQISIDGNPRGAVADLADRKGLLPLAPGIYQVSLKAPGYVSWRAEVALRAGTETIRVNLMPKQ